MVRGRGLRGARPELAGPGRGARPRRARPRHDRVLRGEDAAGRCVRLARRSRDVPQAAAAPAAGRAGGWPTTVRAARRCGSTSPRCVPTAAAAGTSTCSRTCSDGLSPGAARRFSSRNQHPVCQCRRSSGASSGITTLCPSPGRISWSQPGQRYVLSAWYGCTCRTSIPPGSVQSCPSLTAGTRPTTRATRRPTTRSRRARCRCRGAPADGTG